MKTKKYTKQRIKSKQLYSSFNFWQNCKFICKEIYCILRHPRDCYMQIGMWVFFVLTCTPYASWTQLAIGNNNMYSTHLFRAMVVFGAEDLLDLILQPTSTCDVSSKGFCSSSSSSPPPPPTKRLVVSSITSKVAGPGSIRFRLRLQLREVVRVLVELELFSSVVVVVVVGSIQDSIAN